MSIALRPLTTGELLDQTFALYRSRFGLFVGIVSLPYFLFLVFRIVFFGLLLHPGALHISRSIVRSLLFSAASISLTAVAHAATVMAVSNVYLDRPAAVLDSYSRIAFRLPRIVLLSMLVWLGVVLGFFMLVLPAFIFMSMWAVAVPVAVLEGRGITASMSRSSYLTKGNRWRFLLIIVIFATINIIVGLAINRIVGLLAGISVASPFASLWVNASVGVGRFVAFSLIGPLGTIALSLAYYDERVRKEAFDLELMMAAIDAHQRSVAPAT